MSTDPITLSDVLTFIRAGRTEDDLSAIRTVLKQAEERARRDRAAGIREEDPVRLRDLSPKCLNGLTGKVAPRSIRGVRCDVLLDEASTQLLRYQRSRFRVPEGATEYTIPGVPLACVEKITAPVAV